MNRVTKGHSSERLAESFLEEKGLRILERNFRCKEGEIDIIALANDFLVFVEVRSSFENSSLNPLESISFRKRERLKKTALRYLQKYPEVLNRQIRFDVISICWSRNGEPQIEWIQNAFEVFQ